MAVPKYKLTDIHWGTVSITPGTISIGAITEGTAAVVDLKTTDKILAIMQGTGNVQTVVTSAKCGTDGVLSLYIANLSESTAAIADKEFLWMKLAP
jgi:hypothetical protein